jgi:hypothetical protein
MSEKPVVVKRKYNRIKPIEKKPVQQVKPEPEPEKDVQLIIKEVTRLGYEKVLLYIYYKGNVIDTLMYIKEFQAILDKFKIGSMVLIESKEHVESVGINNCYASQDSTPKWTDRADTNIALQIKERPRCTPDELYSLIRTENEYEDDFVLLTQI